MEAMVGPGATTNRSCFPVTEVRSMSTSTSLQPDGVFCQCTVGVIELLDSCLARCGDLAWNWRIGRASKNS